MDSLSKCSPLFNRLNHIPGYQKLLDRIPDFAWLMDKEGKIAIANQSWQDYLGATHIVNSNFWDLVLPASKAEIKHLWQINYSALDVWEHQLKLKNQSGNYQLFDLQAEPLISNTDNSLLICTAKPVDESLTTLDAEKIIGYKQKESILVRQTEFIHRILESSQDCIKVLDLQGRLLYMNDGGQDLMEIDDFDRQIRQEPWLNFWHGCDREVAKQAFRAASGGKIGRFDGYCTTAKGTPKWWEVVVTPMLDEDNRVSEILSVSRDITARKVAQETLQERNQELDRFTYAVTHDLKAPLRGISNLSAMIVEDLHEQLPVVNQHQLELLQQRVLRMDALINGLLNYSRIGREVIAVESVDVGELLQEVIDSLAPPPGFQIFGTPPLPTLVTKKILLTQVLANLISNAIKHHDRDTGEIKLTVKDCDRYYEFAIADDGPGIPETERERIFQIFQTIENKTSTTNTGIGLALIEKIVTGEGGKFWLDSETYQGSKFCFTWNKRAS